MVKKSRHSLGMGQVGNRNSGTDFIQVSDRPSQEQSMPWLDQEDEKNVNKERTTNGGSEAEEIGYTSLTGISVLEHEGTVDRLGLGQSGVPGPSGLGGGSDRPCQNPKPGCSSATIGRKKRQNMTELIELLDNRR